MFTTGDLTSTGNPLDVAIQGDGFFQVQLPSGGTAYTRSGAFQRNSDGNLVTSDGYLLDPPINVPADALSVSIGEDGTVGIKKAGTAALSNQGQLTAVRFSNTSGLRAVGRNLYEETSSSGNAATGIWGQDGYGRLAQNFLESSNVSVVEQVVNMITAQRAYEASSKGISTADEMLSQAINLKR